MTLAWKSPMIAAMRSQAFRALFQRDVGGSLVTKSPEWIWGQDVLHPRQLRGNFRAKY
jgi:hypothetical protein